MASARGRAFLARMAFSCENLEPYAGHSIEAFGCLRREAVDAILCDSLLIAHHAREIAAIAAAPAERLNLERLATLHGDGGPVVSLRSLWCYVVAQVPKVHERIRAALSEESTPC